MNFCPSCGHDLKQYKQENVKGHQKQPDLVDAARESEDPARWSFSDPDKSKGRGQIRDAKQRLSDPLTEEVKADIVALHRQGYALARIRQMLGLPMSVTLARIRGVVERAERKQRRKR